MNILALDTCFDACSVAIGVEIGGAGERREGDFEHRHEGHAEALMPMIAAAMGRAGLAFDAIDRIAVTRGPGTFTGTRIGIAAARGLALATGAGIVTATSLEVMARQAAASLADLMADEVLAVVMDARRASVYVQVFEADGIRALGPPWLLSIEEAVRLEPARELVCVGSGAELVATAARTARRGIEAQLPDLTPEAATLLAMAIDMAPQPGPPAPLYLRPADAKPQAGKSIERL